MAKRSRCSTSSNFSTPNWAGLDPDLLGLILHKLVYIPNYISFNSVCKPWNSLSSTHKEKQALLNNKQQLPWLLLSSLNNDQNLLDEKLKLYNFIGKQMSNFQILISSRDEYSCWYGSSHGWLITSKTDSALILLNPLSGATIHLPPLRNRKIMKVSGVTRVILSRDPCSGSFEVLAHCAYNMLAHHKYGDKFWTYSSTKIFPPIYYHDITFYKDRMLGVNERGGILSIDVVNHGDEFSKIKINEIAPDLMAESFVDGYFVETTNGDLLMVYRYYTNSVNTSAYEVHRLIMDSNGNLERIPVANLGGESLFLGQRSCGMSVLASNYPECMPNTIYCGVYFIDDLDRQLKVEVFNLENKSVATSCFPTGCLESSFPTWLVPTMKL
ncbi:hypothetical protein FNV43_RR02021 [Rhamnella rubrinervis]|uniref:KIB1-4 beta-propeller domain-containing protein n=1 Tax=Rhamnella rubrinervis TaxID=2594499 RepID=A0A8K0HTB4_9ROSA|nr:hypothetical protein FNV43_RR02021 [Rhamnella rubrinervis]